MFRAGWIVAAATVFAISGFVAPASADVGIGPEPTGGDQRVRYTSIRVLVDGKPVDWGETLPVVDNGRTLVPLRRIIEITGDRAIWDSGAGRATIIRNTALHPVKDEPFFHAEFSVWPQEWSPVAEIRWNEPSPAASTPMEFRYHIRLETYSRIYYERTYIPLRLFEALGYRVDYEAATNTARLDTTKWPVASDFDRVSSLPLNNLTWRGAKFVIGDPTSSLPITPASLFVFHRMIAQTNSVTGGSDPALLRELVPDDFAVRFMLKGEDRELIRAYPTHVVRWLTEPEAVYFIGALRRQSKAEGVFLGGASTLIGLFLPQTFDIRKWALGSIALGVGANQLQDLGVDKIDECQKAAKGKGAPTTIGIVWVDGHIVRCYDHFIPEHLSLEEVLRPVYEYPVP